jgi:hypothetical protein
MNHLTFGILLVMASVMALGQAAPLNSNAQRIYYQGALNHLNTIATQQSVNYGELLRAAGHLVDAIRDSQAKEQWLSYPVAEEQDVDYGDLARAIGGAIDAFKHQEKLANQQSLHAKDYGQILTNVGGLVDAFGR